MRKGLCLMMALVLSLTMACTVFAETGTFVPSISYKDGPDVVDADMNDEDVTECIVVTSLKEAKEKTTDIYQEDRDLLWEVYEKLSDNSMELPIEDKDYVVRELVDVSFRKTDCVEVPHNHKQWLAQDDTTITIVFDLGVKKNVVVEVFAYLNEQWVPVVSTVNNGDGTVAVEFEDICPVAFCVEADSAVEPPYTGDTIGADLTVWFVLFAVSIGAIVILLVNRRRFLR